VEDVLINVGGFIPFGVTLSALLTARWRSRRASTVTVLIGFFVSLAIETLQSRLPTRNSDFTDVLTNAIGTGMGVAIYNRSQGLVKELFSAVAALRPASWDRV
jgi:glycopeptide antibiotics resistance protein